MGNSDYYSQSSSTNKYASVSSSGDSSTPSSNDSWNDTKISTKNNDTSRFSSVGSGQNYSDDQDPPSGYFSSFKYYLGSALTKTAQAALVIKDKVSEMELGTKLKNTGIRTVEIIKDTGMKVKVM